MNEHILGGCRITPLSNYLKSLGLLKILAEKESGITAHWKNDVYTIKTEMTKDQLTEFLLNEYCPSPLLNIWSYSKYEKMRKNVEGLIRIDKKRFRLYADTIKQTDHVLKKFKQICKIAGEITKNDVSKNKNKLLKLCRNYLPDEALPWLDAIFVLNAGQKPHYAPILGSGANDGNYDIAENFIKCVNTALGKKEESKKWLSHTLFGSAEKLDNMNSLGHNPDGCGGPNSGMGFEGKPLSSPWDYILMVEGTLLFAGNVSKRQSTNTGKAVFPFTSSSTNVGYSTSSSDERSDGNNPTARGEIWVPIWTRPATYGEINHVFNEGRIQLGRKPAKTGTDFARAIISLGTDRGISKFQRFCILQRKGRDHLTIDAGPIWATKEPAADLLYELDKDDWYTKIIRKSKEDNAPKSLINLARKLEKSIMRFCASRKNYDLLKVLVAVGNLEQYTSSYDGYRPLQSLSSQWLDKCYDGSVEFRLAASIASIRPANKVGGIRENMEFVQEKNGIWVHNKNSVSCVWKKNADILKNLSSVLKRRCIDGKIHLLDTVPITGYIPAQVRDIVEFLNGRVDKKMGDLILPFSIIQMADNMDYPWSGNMIYEHAPLPEAYRIIKMIYPPDKKESIPYDISVVNMLSAGRINAAYRKAAYMLRAHELVPVRYDSSTTLSDSAKKAIMPSLIFPISRQDRRIMLKSVTKQN